MPTIVNPSVGTFCWPELCSGNADGSKKFYSSLFGWTADDLHMPGGDYTIFKLGDAAVGAMYEMKKERADAGVSPQPALTWSAFACSIS